MQTVDVCHLQPLHTQQGDKGRGGAKGGGEEEKVPRNTAALYSCTAPRVTVNQPRDRTVVYFITLTG